MTSSLNSWRGLRRIVFRTWIVPSLSIMERFKCGQKPKRIIHIIVVFTGQVGVRPFEAHRPCHSRSHSTHWKKRTWIKTPTDPAMFTNLVSYRLDEEKFTNLQLSFCL